MIAGKVVVVCGYGDVGKAMFTFHAALYGHVLCDGSRPDLRIASGNGRL